MNEERSGRSVVRRLLPWFLVLAALVGIAIQRARITRGATDDPILTIDFPASAAPGSVQQAVLEVHNPASEEIEDLWLSFSLVGVAGGSGVPQPLVGPAAPGGGRGVLDIDPRPRTTAEGVRFGFGPLEPGATMTIEFDLRMPERTGPAGNAVLAYDGANPERAQGEALETTLGG